MKRYLLDSGPLSAYLFGRPPALALLGSLVARREVCTSIVAYGEVVEYIRGFPDTRARQRQLFELMEEIRLMQVTFAIMERYADLRRSLRPPHGPGLIGDIDTILAATALHRGLTVLTTDSDFDRVPGLVARRVVVR